MRKRNQHIITIVYVVLWLMVAIVYLFDILRSRNSMGLDPIFEWKILIRIVIGMAPFVILFLINNLLLIPRLLLRNRPIGYLTAVLVIIAIAIGYQYMEFHSIKQSAPPPPLSPMAHPPHRLLPLPLLLDLIYDMLVIGINLAISLIFQRFDDQLEHERLMKANAENELSYLKGQMNPHFYMNMLNNIHAMIEIDGKRAQAMVLDMSQLLRYMLYDSSQPKISLSDEIEFIRNYLRIMRARFSENRVSISATFPEEATIHKIKVAPLMFLVFIENAFKHGISYREKSFVALHLEIYGDDIRFSISNSRHESEPGPKSPNGGIGLRNIQQRLSLIYGERASLSISETPKSYFVTLTVPINDSQNTGD